MEIALLAKCFLYAATVVMFACVLYLVAQFVEQIIRMTGKHIPYLQSHEKLRDALAHEINTHYPNMKTACEIGSGYGGLARLVAKKCDMRVTAIEIMPFAAMVSKIADYLTRAKSRTICGDAFRRLSKSDGFDIAIAYMGPGIGERLAAMHGKFRVLITMDFPVTGVTATRIIDLPGGGATIYKGKEWPHRIFVYELP